MIDRHNFFAETKQHCLYRRLAGRDPLQYDLRFSRYFGTSPGLWHRLQLDYDLIRAERENGERITREVQPHAA